MKHFFTILALFTFNSIFAQSTFRVVDAQTGESIPYANIKVGDTENLVSNAEGYFAVSESNGDSAQIQVTYLGYVSRVATVGEIKDKNNRIAMSPAVFEVENVKVEKPDPNAIMRSVLKNLGANYKTTAEPTKNLVFFRESDWHKPKQLEIEIAKSSGYTKKSLSTANNELKGYTSQFVKYPPRAYTDMLFNYYTTTETKAEKTVVLPKFEVLKATLIKDDNKAVSMTNIEQGAGKLFLQHLDSTRYYRIKSGWFGTQDTVTLRGDYNKKKKKKKNITQISTSKGKLVDFMTKSNFLQSDELDFVRTPDIYEYTYGGSIFNADNELVYVLNFKPDSRKAKFQGKLYISQKDFAVLRTDYQLLEGKQLSNMNWKLLLGIKVSENFSKGTLIFKPNTRQEGYYLQYASKEEGQYIYINRDIQFIELTEKDEKDLVKFDLKAEIDSKHKSEYLNISNNEVSAADYANVTEADFKFIRLKKYDPSIWKGVSAIEPLEEMKQFSIVE